MTVWRIGVAVGILVLGWGVAEAQNPPNAWHPYRGGTNCIQVADAQGNFNCAGKTTVDPTTGNLVVGGSLTFTGGTGGLLPGGVAVVPSSLLYPAPQVLNGDFVLSKSPGVIATLGPGTGYGALRLRQSANGSSCRLVFVVGDSIMEFPVVFMNPATGRPDVVDLPGGSQGC